MKSLGNRMKENYEDRYRISMTRRMPVVLRLDGRDFYTATRGCERPFDEKFSDAMVSTAIYLCRDIQGVKCAFVQSDEISILLTDFDTLETEGWFNYNVQKIVSVSAGLASAYFSLKWKKPIAEAHRPHVFDCRAFNVPKEEVCNYFVWRQKDWLRNSVSMLAQSHFSHKELLNKSQTDMHEMLSDKGIKWTRLPDKWKNGTFISRGPNNSWLTCCNIIFTSHRDEVEKYLNFEYNSHQPD
jgi:tRNA(His) 5'-end guanylyltransferase